MKFVWAVVALFSSLSWAIPYAGNECAHIVDFDLNMTQTDVENAESSLRSFLYQNPLLPGKSLPHDVIPSQINSRTY